MGDYLISEHMKICLKCKNKSQMQVCLSCKDNNKFKSMEQKDEKEKKDEQE